VKNYIKAHAVQLFGVLVIAGLYLCGVELAHPELLGLALTATYWSSADLKALTAGGLVNEDVIQRIIDISHIPRPFMDHVGVGEPADNAYTEWTQDALGAVDLTNKVVDGADATGNQAAGGTRVGNHLQQSDKVVQVTYRANASDVIGRSNELAYQLMMRTDELMNDLEAIALYPQASVADNGDAIAGAVGTFPSWLITNDDMGAGGSATGFNTSTKVVAIPTASTARRALSVATLKTAFENVYLQNGTVSVLMSRPELTRRLANYILANPTTFAVATPTANIAGDASGKVGQIMQGFVLAIVTEFGDVVQIVPNRLQQTHNDGSAAACVDLFGIDTAQVEYTYMIAPRADPLAKLGTAERRQLLADWSLRVLQEKSHFVIRDLNHTTAVTA
jgi:hypothetical protein